MSKISSPPKPFMTSDEAVAYLHSLGFEAATVETLKTHAYRTQKLQRPKIVARHSYWSRKSLNDLVETL